MEATPPPAAAISPRSAEPPASNTALIVATLALYVCHAANYLYFFVDDEGIPFIFAKHLLEGKGLVYNSFEGRVEGYSDLLHILISAGWLSIGHFLGLSRLAPFFFGKAVSFLAGIAVVWLLCRTVVRDPGITRQGRLAGMRGARERQQDLLGHHLNAGGDVGVMLVLGGQFVGVSWLGSEIRRVFGAGGEERPLRRAGRPEQRFELRAERARRGVVEREVVEVERERSVSVRSHDFPDLVDVARHTIGRHAADGGESIDSARRRRDTRCTRTESCDGESHAEDQSADKLRRHKRLRDVDARQVE